METYGRPEGLWVVMTRPPHPDGEFVELEDEAGRGVGPSSGITWRQEGDYWLLGPFATPTTTAAAPEPELLGIADIVVALAREAEGNQQRHLIYESEQAAARKRIAQLEHDRDLLAASSIGMAQIEAARRLVTIYGDIAESAEGAFEAALVAVASGGRALLTEYIGAKRYSGYHQRCDCRYGYGPKHGSIVFAIELTREVRSRSLEGNAQPLDTHERNLATGYLLAEKALAAQRRRERC